MAVHNDRRKLLFGLWAPMFLVATSLGWVAVGLFFASVAVWYRLLPVAVEAAFFLGTGLPALGFGFSWLRNMVRRLRNPTRLLIGENGFQYFPGVGPIMWNEVSTVGPMSLNYRGRRIATVGVLLADPADFATRHRLGRFATLGLRLDSGRLNMGSFTIEPFGQTMQTALRTFLTSQARTDWHPGDN